jgi:hypothetical protein
MMRSKQRSRTVYGAVGKLVLAPLFALALGSPAKAQLSNVGSFGWLNVDQATCVNRAIQSMQAANARFNLNLRVTPLGGWYVVLDSRDFHAGIHCVADDGVSGAMVIPSARRVEVTVTVSADHPMNGLEGQIRDFLWNCMARGCTAAPAQRGAVLSGGWQSTGGMATVTITQNGNAFTFLNSNGIRGQGTISGGQLRAQCIPAVACGGGATLVGTVTQSDTTGVARRIQWTDGDVWTR